MSLLTNKKLGAVIKETTGGTYLQPIANDFPINDLELVQVDLGLKEYGRPADGTMSRGKYVSGKQQATIGFTSFMMEPALTGDPCPTHPLFQMAGGHVVDDAITFDGNPNCFTYSIDHIVLGCYAPGSVSPSGSGYKLRGAKADLTFGAEAPGAPVIVQVSATCAVEAHTDAQAGTLPAPYFGDKVVDRFIGSAFSLNGATLDIQSFSCALGNAILLESNAGKAGLGDYATITDVDTKVSITSRVGATTAGLWAKATGDTAVGDLVVTCSLFTYTFADCTIATWSEEDAEGILVLSMELNPKSISIVPNP